MSDFINEHNTIIGIIIILIGGYSTFKNGKLLFDELIENKFIQVSFTVKIFGAWLIIFIAGILIFIR